MKQLIRRLSRVADSSQSHYCLLRPTDAVAAQRPGRAHSFRAAAANKFRRSRSEGAVPVPQGHVPVYVGDEMERFAVSAELLNHPVFVTLLEKSAQEYGYEQKGVLRIPCHVLVFERVLEAIRIGDHDSRDLNDLLSSLSGDFL
ncbi:auxin-responsive protein SAUR71 [Benincasa hispida]|uniref:auxin-responsive protein SAUR71 n=1 Tax=Benincasa hispida TaxID=102211 RepID=UPI001902312F|nr:auxin-responsive protein SAUR71 [Benincasa hispida]